MKKTLTGFTLRCISFTAMAALAIGVFPTSAAAAISTAPQIAAINISTNAGVVATIDLTSEGVNVTAAPDTKINMMVHVAQIENTALFAVVYDISGTTSGAMIQSVPATHFVDLVASAVTQTPGYAANAVLMVPQNAITATNSITSATALSDPAPAFVAIANGAAQATQIVGGSTLANQSTSGTHANVSNQLAAQDAP